MKKDDYQGLDLSLFRLTESGEPLAEPLEAYFLVNVYRDLSGEGATLSLSGYTKAVDAIAKRVHRFVTEYKKPFTPSEHLTGEKAMFGGWEESRSSTPSIKKLFTNGKGLGLVAFEVYSGSIRLNGFDLMPLTGPIPQTLSHFINDCNRAGIPLFWTPYACELLTGKEKTP